MAVFNVHYTVYEPNSTFIVSEGVMPVNAQMSNQAEAVVRSMFGNNTVNIHYTTQA